MPDETAIRAQREALALLTAFRNQDVQAIDFMLNSIVGRGPIQTRKSREHVIAVITCMAAMVNSSWAAFGHLVGGSEAQVHQSIASQFSKLWEDE